MRMRPLGEIIDINPRLPRGTNQDQAASFIAMADVGEDGSWGVSETKTVGDLKKGYTYFANNDVVFAKITPCFENGKAAHFSGLPTDVGFGSTEFHVLRPNSDVDGRYLFYAVWNPVFRALGTWRMSGAVGQKRVTADFLKKYKIPLPPLSEQKRIAAILDKADAIRRKRKAALDMADEFLRATFLDMFGDIPAKKPKYPLGTIRGLVKAKSGKSSKAVLAENQTDYPVYGGNGVNGWAKEALYMKPVLVLGRVGQQCGVTYLTKGPAWVTDNAIVIEVCDQKKLNSTYLKTAFEMSPLRATVQQLDLPFINQGIVLDQQIPMPPIDIQKKYEKIYQHVQIKKGIMTAREGLNHQADTLFASLSQRAFQGDL